MAFSIMEITADDARKNQSEYLKKLSDIYEEKEIMLLDIIGEICDEIENASKLGYDSVIFDFEDGHYYEITDLKDNNDELFVLLIELLRYNGYRVKYNDDSFEISWEDKTYV